MNGSLASKLTEGIKSRNKQISVYLDEDAYGFLTLSSVVMSMRESQKAYDLAKKGRKNVKATAFVESREASRAIETMASFSHRMEIESVEDIGAKMSELVDLEAHLMAITGAKSISAAVKKIESMLKERE